MTCPWCDFDGSPRALHAHLGDEHNVEAVGTEYRADTYFYTVGCPRCGAKYRHRIKKGIRDPGFLGEFEREIRMVALDMLVNHLMAEHENGRIGD